jgi:thiol:disulfide interchange protein DsbC
MFKRWLSAAVLALFCMHAVAGDAEKAVDEALAKIFPSSKPTQVIKSELPGFYQAIINGQVFYVSVDGKYLIHGSVFDIDAKLDIGEQQLSDLRKGTLARIPANKQIVFAPANPKYTITVFTDVDCPYCRQFHKQIADYNRLGIAVNYVLFPLAIHPGADKKAEAVWCSADRNTSYTDAMNGKDPGQKTCANPIGELTEIGKAMGVDGTPAIFTADGEHVGGYLPPDKLAQRLDQLAARERKLSAR